MVQKCVPTWKFNKMISRSETTWSWSELRGMLNLFQEYWLWGWNQDLIHTLIHNANLSTRWKKPENLKETNRDRKRTCTEMVIWAQGQTGKPGVEQDYMLFHCAIPTKCYANCHLMLMLSSALTVLDHKAAFAHSTTRLSCPPSRVLELVEQHGNCLLPT